MKLTMTEGSEKYGAPAGLYRAKFLGAKADTHPEYGAGLKWEFEITEGPSAGKVVSRTTSPVPTSKNACGKMLQMLTGGVAALNQEFDLDRFVGQLFQVMVEANSTGNGTRVGSVMPLAGAAAPPPQQPAAAPAAAGRPAPPPARPPAPPPAPPTTQPAAATAPPAAPSAAPAEEWFWVQMPGADGPQRRNREWLQSAVDAAEGGEEGGAIRVMSGDGAGGWKSAADFGVTPTIPF